MSKFCGKCDLYDHIYMIGQKEDETELECFERFKKETNGTLYQDIRIEITKNNIDALIEYSEKTEDIFGITKEGKIYKYFGREYPTFKKLIKDNPYFYKTREIHFETIIDLVKYYPYIITRMSSSKNDDGERSSHIVISSRSFLDMEREERMGFCENEPRIYPYYENLLNKEYIRLAKEYY